MQHGTSSLTVDTSYTGFASIAGAGAGAPGHQYTDVTPDQLVELLHAAGQQQDGPTVAALCSCQAAAQLDLAIMHELLLAAAAGPLCMEQYTNEEQHLEEGDKRLP
jgi:hypothetical protein